MQRRVLADQVVDLLGCFLLDSGVHADWAAPTAVHLVEGDLRGYHHHGIGRITQIAAGLAAGTLTGSGDPRTVSDRGGLVVLDAAGLLGVPVAQHAIDLLAERVSAHGLAAVGVLNAGHLGILAPFAEQIAAPGRLSVVLSTTEPAAVAPGGRTKLIGTNPIAFACPCGDELLSADFATTPMTRGEVLSRASAGTELPAGVAVDAEGRPTTSPAAALTGGLVAFDGSLKGFLVSVLCSLLAGPALGGLANHEVRGTRRTDDPPSKGDLFLAIDLSGPGTATFAEQVRAFFTMVQADSSVRVPGESARARRARALRDGIDVPDEVWALLAPYRRLAGYDPGESR
jgi:L-2-hydroxycarboxylate dehydrogenase (NAD+)